MDRPSLVIAPTSLITNWRREAAKFSPDLRVLTLHGTHRARLLLLEFALSWAYVEGRAVRRAGVTSTGAHQACEELLSVSRLGVEKYQTLAKVSPSVRSSMALDAKRRGAAPLYHLEALDRGRKLLAERVATFAEVAGRRDLLARSFEVFGGKIKTYKKTYNTPDEFIADPPDFDLQLRLKSTPTQSVLPSSSTLPKLSEGQRAAVKALIQDLNRAVVDKNETRFISLFHERATGQALALNLSNSSVEVLKVDFSNAKFRFDPVGTNEVDVTVSDITTVISKNGERVETMGRKVYRVIFRNGRPLIKGPGEK